MRPDAHTGAASRPPQPDGVATRANAEQPVQTQPLYDHVAAGMVASRRATFRGSADLFRARKTACRSIAIRARARLEAVTGRTPRESSETPVMLGHHKQTADFSLLAAGTVMQRFHGASGSPGGLVCLHRRCAESGGAVGRNVPPLQSPGEKVTWWERTAARHKGSTYQPGYKFAPVLRWQNHMWARWATGARSPRPSLSEPTAQPPNGTLRRGNLLLHPDFTQNV